MARFNVFLFIHQANAVVDMIGFPPYIMNATALDERYQEVRLKC